MVVLKDFKVKISHLPCSPTGVFSLLRGETSIRVLNCAGEDRYMRISSEHVVSGYVVSSYV